MSHCCAPPSEAGEERRPALGPHRRNPAEVPASDGNGSHPIEQAKIPAGTFAMGDAFAEGYAADGEAPVHDVTVSSFSIDVTTVTNAAFAAFVRETGYRTESETFGYSAVFHHQFRGDEGDELGHVAEAPWWLGIAGADWRHPGGRHTNIDGLDDHPVVHVSWNDAQAYCRWAGRRLPTEAEWEYASRGGLAGARFPWGDELGADDATDDGWQCNIWQGDFPRLNAARDGWESTAPVRTFMPNGYGLWQTVGNVWEWCADDFDPAYYRRSPALDPTGPDGAPAKVMRGGSFLCHASYCYRYRNAARSSNTPDSATCNMGFRTVARAERGNAEPGNAEPGGA